MPIAKLIDSFSVLRPNSQRTTESTNCLAHHGIKGMKWGVRRTKEQLEQAKQSADVSFAIHRSVGAKSKNYDIEDKGTGEVFHFAEGTKIQNAQVFAGKNSSKSLKAEVREGLGAEFKNNPLDWQHCKGNGIIDYYGEERPAEVHWFQAENIGKCKFKIKRWLDE